MKETTELEQTKMDYLSSIYTYWSHNDRTKEELFLNFQETFSTVLPYKDQLSAIEYFICEGLNEPRYRKTPEQKQLWTVTQTPLATRTEADWQQILAAIVAETKAMIDSQPPREIVAEYTSLVMIPRDQRTTIQTERLGALAIFIYEYRK